MAQYGVTPEGFNSKNYQTCLAEIVENYKSAFPEFKEHESNALYLQAQAQANQEEQLWSALEAVYNSQFVLTSEHTALDYRTIDRIGRRADGTYASGKVTISGSIGTKIFQGDLLRTSEESGLRFRILASKIIPSTGFVDVEVQCTTSGLSGNVFPHTIVSFVNTKVGITNVDNPNVLAGGRESETDLELRERYFKSLQDFRGSNIPAIASRLRRVPDIIAHKIRENKTNRDRSVEGILMPPHSIGVTVIGGLDSEVGEALLNSKAGGVDDLGSTLVKVPDIGGALYDIRFTRGTGTPTYIKIELTVTKLFLSSNIEVIKAQVVKYINQLSIEEDLLYNQLIAKAFSGINEVSRFNLYIGKAPNPTGQVDITATQHEKFVVDMGDISVIRS